MLHDAAQRCRVLLQGEGATNNATRRVLYHGLPDERLKNHLVEGLLLPSKEGFRGAGLYTTPKFDEAVKWVTRHGGDKYSVLRFDIDAEVWQSLIGKEMGWRDSSDKYRTVLEQFILSKHPEFEIGFPRSQAAFDNLIEDVLPVVNKKIDPIQAVDYLYGEVPLPGGGFGYEYVFKSQYVLQDILSNPSVTNISVIGPRQRKWRPITFPRR